jgi:hypothetical protein
MKLLAIQMVSVAVFASTMVFTRAFAQDNAQAHVDLTGQEQGVRNNAQHPDSGEGAGTSGMSQGGRSATMPNDRSNTPEKCVGPVSFCTLYFGS